MANRFNRFLLPGFAFKALVIGGGYATGRELVEFFLPFGPRGGLISMVAAMIIWSAVCTLTFLFARQTQSYDYKAFFKQLLGPGWWTFEVSNFLSTLVILAVFAAAAGSIGEALFGWPQIYGSIALMCGIAGVVMYGNNAVERLFKYVSIFLYAVYAIFLVLALSTFGDRIADSFASSSVTPGWLMGSIKYSGYNIIGAALVLPVIRHMRSNKDAVVAGLLCGPLAMVPAMLFFICMTAYYPAISAETLPSNFLLEKLNLPIFHFAFQTMIFAALLECGAGSVHAINQRIASAYATMGKDLAPRARFVVAAVLLVMAVFVADKVGLIDLIGKGYLILSFVFIAVYLIPLLTYGVWRLVASSRKAGQTAALAVAEAVQSA